MYPKINILKNHLTLFLFWITIPYYGHAQENSLLWEISGNNLKEPSYLFGTMHVKDKRAFQFHDSLLTYIKSCQSFTGELVLDKKEAKSMAADVLLPPGQELNTLVSKADYKKIKKYCSKNLGFMALVVNKIKPVFTSALISESLLSSDMPMALDEYLQDYAQKNSIPVYGLESIADQLSVLDELSLIDQAKLLVEQINNIEEERKALQNLADSYASENLDTIASYLNSPEMSGEFGDALVTNRNIIMANRLDEILKKESTFCAIGAAHLPGEMGVIQLLKLKGYFLRPIFK